MYRLTLLIWSLPVSLRVRQAAVAALLAVSPLYGVVVREPASAATWANTLASPTDQRDLLLKELPRMPQGTHIYAIDTYAINSGTLRRYAPADARISRTSRNVLITFDTGRKQKFPANSVVTFEPKSAYILILPKGPHPKILTTKFAHLIR